MGLVRAAAAAIAHTLLAERALAGSDPFSRRDGWHAHGQQRRIFALEFHGEAVVAELVYGHTGALQVTLAGQSSPLEFSVAAAGLAVAFAGERFTAKIESNRGFVYVFTALGATEIIVIDRLAAAAAAAGSEAAGGRLTAPMPGKVVSFAVQAGDRITQGQPLAVMDAMKMEHTIAAPSDGVVLALLFAPGDQVAEGEELLTIGQDDSVLAV